MQGSFAQADSDEEQRLRLDAMANVPWENISAGTDRRTAELTKRHREMERVYDAAPADKKVFMSKVMPYPETPDEVFPATACYRLLVDGATKLVFVLVPGDANFPVGWNGQCRPQRSAHWIVPHFIYRNPAAVAAAKARYHTVFSANMVAAIAPPNREDFNSAAIAGPGPVPPGGDRNDSYYVFSTDNNQAGAPSIEDPLFASPFYNKNPARDATHTDKPRPVRAVPYPYHQPQSKFPRQPTPAEVYTAAPAAARGRGRGAAQQVRVVPNDALTAVLPPVYKGRENHDWIPASANNFEISADVLKEACEKAEELDYAFALSMQGLRGTNLSAVWVCVDPEYDVTDRAAVLAQFVKLYMEKFYGQVSVTGQTDVEEVVHEALRMHEEFCKGWITRHHKTLSAEIVAASEALVGLFYDDLKAYITLPISRQQLSRYLRRSTTYSTEFSHCLYHYMTSLEQGRGNRNPSYKAMDKEHSMYITAMKSMAQLMQSHLHEIQTTFRALDDTALLFDYRFIDWHHISAQMPQHHKEFEGYANSFNLYRSRAGGRANAFPPWQQGRR
jgi:hypothetical protein